MRTKDKSSSLVENALFMNAQPHAPNCVCVYIYMALPRKNGLLYMRNYKKNKYREDSSLRESGQQYYYKNKYYMTNEDVESYKTEEIAKRNK